MRRVPPGFQPQAFFTWRMGRRFAAGCGCPKGWLIKVWFFKGNSMGNHWAKNPIKGFAEDIETIRYYKI